MSTKDPHSSPQPPREDHQTLCSSVYIYIHLQRAVAVIVTIVQHLMPCWNPMTRYQRQHVSRQSVSHDPSDALQKSFQHPQLMCVGNSLRDLNALPKHFPIHCTLPAAATGTVLHKHSRVTL
jgi:hypothetical protein